MGQCDQFVTVYSDGLIYGCDSFPKTGALCFGSVLNEPAVVKSNSRLQSFRELLKERKDRCQACNWYFICQGGCAKDCYEQLDSVEPLGEICENLKRYFGHISDKIKSYDLTELRTEHSYTKGGENHVESCSYHEGES